MGRGTVIILAGGEGRRIGRDKALIDAFGEPLVVRLARVLAPGFEHLIVVANKDLDLDLPAAAIVPDIHRGLGPLGGIHAGLSRSSTEDNFVIACDMPFVSPEIVERIRALRGDAQVALAETGDGIEPLCASYSRTCLPAIEEVIRVGERRIISFFDRVVVRAIRRDELVDVPGFERAFVNVNTEEDLADALNIAGTNGVVE